MVQSDLETIKDRKRSYMKIDKNKLNAKASNSTMKMVRSISDGDNVEAYKLLDKVVKQKVAAKIDAALKSID